MNGIEIAKKLVAEAACIKPEELTVEIRLFHDLGIDGDDAEELLVEVRDKYNVNFDDFDFSKYFGSEVGAGWRHVIDRYLVKFGWSGYGFKPITIGELGKAIDLGEIK